ncbi:MAG TPA: type I restriction endonuclease, partial [Cellvibrio sp.]|nr:type I restriction endonuclease [Cellvibrio sp.]
MTNDEFDKVELPALEQLQKLGWQYISGLAFLPTPDGEREYFREVVLGKRLRSAILRINPWISDENLRKVMRDITHPTAATLMEANQNLWHTLVNYQSVEQDLGKGRKGQTVKIIDFDNIANNEFLCVNQFKIEGINENIIPDILCFVNGLPLAIIEAKSPYITNPMESGITQLRRYANRRTPHEDEGAEKLFWYNQLMVSTHRDKAAVGTISSKVEHYLEWKDAYPFDTQSFAHSQEVLLAGLFSHANFLDVIQNFTLFEAIDG